MKWYFAANLNALRHAFDQLQTAVRSARANTQLQPICLLDDQGHPNEVSDRVKWLVSAGVSVVPRKADLFAIVRAHFGSGADVFSGHWLRCDIPVLEMEADYVLYTDIDVMFRRPVELATVRPSVLACAPEQWPEDLTYFNSGVMVMNLPALRATRDRFIEVLKRRLSSMQPHDDQGVFNVTYRNEWDRLPNSLNWKPYWGVAADANIIHFHGPKPHEVRRVLAGEEGIFNPELEALFLRSPDGYAQYLAEFDTVLAGSDYIASQSADDWHRAENGRLAAFLQEGWSGLEAWGVWGLGAMHGLLVAMPGGAVDIAFDVHAALFPARPRQAVDVLVNGEPAALWRFTETENHATRTIRVVSQSDEPVYIALRPYTVFRVCDLDRNDADWRELGVALHGIRITPI